MPIPNLLPILQSLVQCILRAVATSVLRPLGFFTRCVVFVALGLFTRCVVCVVARRIGPVLCSVPPSFLHDTSLLHAFLPLLPCSPLSKLFGGHAGRLPLRRRQQQQLRGHEGAGAGAEGLADGKEASCSSDDADPLANASATTLYVHVCTRPFLIPTLCM